MKINNVFKDKIYEGDNYTFPDIVNCRCSFPSDLTFIECLLNIKIRELLEKIIEEGEK